MIGQRESVMVAARASLQAMYPNRTVLRGMQDWAALGDAKLRQGVLSLIAESTDGWTGHVGRESESGTLAFAIVAYGLAPDAEGTEGVETLEAAMEDELLAWCRAAKPAPIDAVYPRRASYSRGLDAPVAWVVMELEALYV